MFCRPANSTRHMNEVVSQMSGMATENRTMSGLLEPADLVGVLQDARLVQQGADEPEVVDHAGTATAGRRRSGAIISGYRNMVRQTCGFPAEGREQQGHAEAENELEGHHHRGCRRASASRRP